MYDVDGEMCVAKDDRFTASEGAVSGNGWASTEFLENLWLSPPNLPTHNTVHTRLGRDPSLTICQRMTAFQSLGVVA
jgi:hypothetical protein